jgi:hypothetical protein
VVSGERGIRKEEVRTGPRRSLKSEVINVKQYQVKKSRFDPTHQIPNLE